MANDQGTDNQPTANYKLELFQEQKFWDFENTESGKQEGQSEHEDWCGGWEEEAVEEEAKQEKGSKLSESDRSVGSVEVADNASNQDQQPEKQIKKSILI